MKKGKWTEIFRAGDYGAKGSYSKDDLDRMVANFNTEDQVPIVLGHPETDSPAWGWLSEVKREGDVLLARPDDLHADFERALGEKQFKNRSVRIGETDSGPKLLHLGYLGATLPQVEGLKTAQFTTEGKSADYNFDVFSGDTTQNQKGCSGHIPRKNGTPNKESNMEKDQKIKDLEKELAAEKAARKTEKEAAAKKEEAGRKSAFARFVEDKMIATGKLAKERKDEAVAFMMTLPVGRSADFSWGDADNEKDSSVDWFKDFIAGVASPDFVSDLPDGVAKDFSSKVKPAALVDLSHQV